MGHHSHLNIYKMTQGENNMVFLGYGNNSYLYNTNMNC